MNSIGSRLLYILLTMSFSFNLSSQNIDHWETALYNDVLWDYSLGHTGIPISEWFLPDFDDSVWFTSEGGFGYGDDDDNTFITNAKSVFMRTEFEVYDTSDIELIVFHADYDDGFVAYLNGVELLRSNLGSQGEVVPFDESAREAHEAQLYLNQAPERYFITDKSLFKEGTNLLAIQTHNFGDNSSDMTSNYFISFGIKSPSMNYEAVPEWFYKSIPSSNLPLVRITTQNNLPIQDEPRISAHMGITFNGAGQLNSWFDIFNEYDGQISIETRGTSSQMFPKKSFSIETQNEDSSNNNVPLLGMPEENDWVLYAPFSDKSLMRNVLTYHLAREAGNYTPRTEYVELFVNDEYQGIYVLTESIKQDKNRVDIAKLGPEDNEGDELTGGYIIKVDRNEDNIPGIGWHSTFPDNKFFAYVDPKSDQITEQQAEYIADYMFEFEEAMFGDNFESVYNDFIDLDSWVDYFIFTELSKHIDAFKLSLYLYKEKDSNGGKLHLGPQWDINLGYGNFDFACSPFPDGFAYEFPDCGSWHPFWARKIFDIPNIQHKVACRWNELRFSVLSESNIINFIDQQVEHLGASIDRNFDQWQILGQYVWPNAAIGETYEQEVQILKAWTSQRLVWLDNNLPGICSQFTSSIQNQESNTISIYPNPASEVLNLSFSENHSGTTAVIVDFLGRTVWTGTLEQNKIDISELPIGMYAITVKSKSGTDISSTFVKSK